VIFADVRMSEAQTVERLKKLGVPPSPCGRSGARKAEFKFSQPCAAFDGQCRVYEDRPRYCREFECAILKGIKTGVLGRDKAEKLIATAHKRAEKMRRLLRELGEKTETLPLSKRFQRVQRRMEKGPITEAMADTFGDLTMAVQDLNVCISGSFYPGE
jgi:Fe-S-cluster containining protein